MSQSSNLFLNRTCAKFCTGRFARRLGFARAPLLSTGNDVIENRHIRMRCIERLKRSNGFKIQPVVTYPLQRVFFAASLDIGNRPLLPFLPAPQSMELSMTLGKSEKWLASISVFGVVIVAAGAYFLEKSTLSAVKIFSTVEIGRAHV